MASEECLKIAFGAKLGDKGDEELFHCNSMIQILIKKLNYNPLRTLSSEEMENVANLLVLFQGETVSRVEHLSMKDLQEILETIPPRRSEIHHETEQEEEELQKKIQQFNMRNARILRRFKALTSAPRSIKDESSQKEDLRELEIKTVEYVNTRAKDLGVDLGYQAPLRSNEDFIRVISVLAKSIHNMETKYTGAVLADEKDGGDYGIGDDDVTAVLITMANNRAAALHAGGRAFQAELFAIKDEGLSEDQSDHDYIARKMLQEDMKMGTDRSFVESLGYASVDARRERKVIDDGVIKLRELKDDILFIHRKELDEILRSLSKHNERTFLTHLRRLKRDQDKSSEDIEGAVQESFSLLETKSKDLQTKYDSLFQKAKLSIIEQFDSSREKLYKDDNRLLKAVSGGSEALHGQETAVKESASPASSPEKDSKEGEEYMDETKEVLLVPWKVAVERELSQFNQAITTAFDEDSSALFTKAVREISLENSAKLDKYLNAGTN